MLVTGSDDFTMFMWNPTVQSKQVARLTGHQQLVNQVAFSPDTRLLASASFDKSIRIWCGSTGRFLKTLRGHVQAVYQLAWSADSRLLVSGSADSTLKVTMLCLLIATSFRYGICKRKSCCWICLVMELMFSPLIGALMARE
jgi:WD40 repeat protein